MVAGVGASEDGAIGWHARPIIRHGQLLQRRCSQGTRQTHWAQVNAALLLPARAIGQHTAAVSQLAPDGCGCRSIRLCWRRATTLWGPGSCGQLHHALQGRQHRGRCARCIPCRLAWQLQRQRHLQRDFLHKRQRRRSCGPVGRPRRRLGLQLGTVISAQTARRRWPAGVCVTPCAPLGQYSEFVHSSSIP
jgi:hypothetical protein